MREVIICCHVDCQLEAKWAPKLCVPATGVPIDTHNPLKIIMSIPVCDDHIGEMRAPDFLSHDPRLKGIFEMMARGRAAPDFERAFIQRVSLNSSEYKIFRKQQEEHRAQEKTGTGDGDKPAEA